jgi:hypothetical protein
MSCPTRYTDTAHEMGLCNCPIKDTMEHTLVIYAQMPESVDMYLIPNKDLEQEDLDTLRLSQNVYVNSTKLSKATMRSTTRLIAAFCEKPEHLPEEHPAGDRWACRWAKFKVDPSEPVLGPNITRVFTTGFVL